MKFFSFSFLWSFFQWFYSGGAKCGFSHFPTLGLQAWKHSYALLLICYWQDLCIVRVILFQSLLILKNRNFCRFYFDFSMTYVGAGMICSHLVNLSLLVGAIASWGIMWPLIGERKGSWFPATLPPDSMKSLNGYKVSGK